MAEIYVIRLSWPSKPLWQNSRCHWAKRARAVAAHKHEAWALAREAAVAKMPNARLEISFHPPDRRRRDIQNMPATMKAAIDGIADAMGCDDKDFRPAWPETFSEVVKGGCAIIRISGDAE